VRRYPPKLCSDHVSADHRTGHDRRGDCPGRQIPTKLVLYLTGAIIASAGAALVSVVFYLNLKSSAAVLCWLGEIGTLVMTRLMAFNLRCIGIQIMWSGWAELNRLARTSVAPKSQWGHEPCEARRIRAKGVCDWRASLPEGFAKLEGMGARWSDMVVPGVRSGTCARIGQALPAWVSRCVMPRKCQCLQ
jgi:hypothetical protein